MTVCIQVRVVQENLHVHVHLHVAVLQVVQINEVYVPIV